MANRKSFGEYIKSVRQEQGLTLQEASETLGYKSVGTLVNVERGLGPLPVEKIHPLARLYKIEVEEILEQLKECEPELYRKYILLEKDLLDYLLEGIKSMGKSKAFKRISQSLSLIIYTIVNRSGLKFSEDNADKR